MIKCYVTNQDYILWASLLPKLMRGEVRVKYE